MCAKGTEYAKTSRYFVFFFLLRLDDPADRTNDLPVDPLRMSPIDVVVFCFYFNFGENGSYAARRSAVDRLPR